MFNLRKAKAKERAKKNTGDQRWNKAQQNRMVVLPQSSHPRASPGVKIPFPNPPRAVFWSQKGQNPLGFEMNLKQLLAGFTWKQSWDFCLSPKAEIRHKPDFVFFLFFFLFVVILSKIAVYLAENKQTKKKPHRAPRHSPQLL